MYDATCEASVHYPQLLRQVHQARDTSHGTLLSMRLQPCLTHRVHCRMLVAAMQLTYSPSSQHRHETHTWPLLPAAIMFQKQSHACCSACHAVLVSCLSTASPLLCDVADGACQKSRNKHLIKLLKGPCNSKGLAYSEQGPSHMI